MDTVCSSIINKVSSVVLGKEYEIKLALCCLLAKGHLLIEDLPGMGKTTLAHGLAKVLGLEYQRIQFTNDLLPADILGLSIYQEKEQQFTLHKGAIFSQLLLADEINRASPKTQSALLEAMEERQVSIDGQSYLLPEPFFVIATQNPLYHSGTYHLPESQLDRFMMRLTLGYPDQAAERNILRSGEAIDRLAQLHTSITPEKILQLQQSVQQVYASDAIIDYVIALCQQTRQADFKGNPLSPRAGKAILQAAKAWAYIDQRNHVLPEDIQKVFPAVCEHRINHAHITDIHHAEQLMSAQLLKEIEPTLF